VVRGRINKSALPFQEVLKTKREIAV